MIIHKNISCLVYYCHELNKILIILIIVYSIYRIVVFFLFKSPKLSFTQPHCFSLQTLHHIFSQKDLKECLIMGFLTRIGHLYLTQGIRI